MLISIREEIAEAGDDVSAELRPPLNRLVECVLCELMVCMWVLMGEFVGRTRRFIVSCSSSPTGLSSSGTFNAMISSVRSPDAITRSRTL